MSKTLKNITFLIISLTIGYNANSQFAPENELRAVWITTAFNIDWPSSTKISTEEQKAEFIRLIETHKQNGINAVFVQIRPSGEVFYESGIEPWSHWLTGEQGKAPHPFYDPLQFMLEECHKRNIEFHAWFNPFRAVSNIARVKTVPWHITKQHPEWFVTYGDEIVKKYFNPGIPDARAYIVKVIMEVVHKYNIDGVHFDDYFYPIREAGKDFPDAKSFQEYNLHGLNKADWRRENINTFIKTLSDSINAVKPLIKFGVGPSGVWRNITNDPDGSKTRGLSSYDEQYADVLKWLREGWIDYVSPQIYWTIGYKVADYQELVDWWSRHTYGKHLYIGQATHRINTTNGWRNPSEIPDQIRLNRLYPEVKGSIFYSSTALLNNLNGVTDSLRNNLYFASASIPEMPWKMRGKPIEIKVELPITDTISKYYNKLNILPEPLAPINLHATAVGKETLIEWKMDESQRKFLADTGSYYKVYRFEGRYPGYPNKNNLYKTTKKPRIMVARKGLFKKKYSFIITAVNSQKKEGWASGAIVVKMKE
ncbi:MAG: family 10 glycosylhydrolase [Bacteroidales bacterium]|nr:family 10 glycosylhydrolase [Bacteroidales bacterium]